MLSTDYRGAVKVPLCVRDHTRVWNAAVISASEAVQDAFVARNVDLVDSPTAPVLASASATTLHGSAIEASVCR